MNYKQIRQLIEKRQFILASGSPRRVAILTEAEIKFQQVVADIDESNSLNLHPFDLAVYLAGLKATKVADLVEDKAVIMGADTIVVLDGVVLGKPTDEEHAVRMLSKLSGRKHTVCTAVALKSGEDMVSGYELTDVYFRQTDQKKIIEYIHTGEPMDKAGAYGIQDRGVFLVDRVTGNIDNVIGMPMSLLERCAGELALKLGLK